MRARAFFKAVTVDRSNALDQFLGLLSSHGADWCLVGGLAINAYVEPVVTLDMDLVLAASDIRHVSDAAAKVGFNVEVFPHSVNLTAAQSDLRIQIQTDPRYQSFVTRAHPRSVLDIVMPVAAVADILQGKIWAFQDVTRRGSKRQKDLADIARLLEAFPASRADVPDDILRRLV